MNIQTDASKVVLSSEARDIKNNIDDYFMLATIPQQHKILEFKNKIQNIKDEPSRIVLETWFSNMIKE